jgi:N-acetylglucosaminyldiphosphoundecaprenol N-acetyl-beta-D-mannosaminyltransferase
LALLDVHNLPIETVDVLGIPVHVLTMADAVAAIERFIQARTPRLVVTADASGLVMARDDAGWRKLLLSADLVTPDSSGVVWAMKRAGVHLSERVSGCDLVGELCGLSAERGYRLYLLGAAPGVAERAAENMASAYPGCVVVGTHHGYFSDAAEPEVLERIRSARPDVLLVAMGMPKQERWIAEHMNRLRVPVSIGVGGTLDVFAGVVRRAPRLFQRSGIEWIWRLAHNPRKIGKVLALPRFAFRVLKGQ